MYRISIINLCPGKIRKLTRKDKKKDRKFKRFKYYVISPFLCKLRYKNKYLEIIVPKGFLSDGSSGGPDYGCSWMIHDYLYSTHRFTSGQTCTRKMADEIMIKILKYEGMKVYQGIFQCVCDMNPFNLFKNAWETSGKRGMIIYNKDEVEIRQRN